MKNKSINERIQDELVEDDIFASGCDFHNCKFENMAFITACRFFDCKIIYKDPPLNNWVQKILYKLFWRKEK